MAIPSRHWFSVEDYHQIEENNPDRKYEYVDGQIFEMSGGTAEHSRIAVNLTREISTHLRRKTCQIVNSTCMSFHLAATIRPIYRISLSPAIQRTTNEALRLSDPHV